MMSQEFILTIITSVYNDREKLSITAQNIRKNINEKIEWVVVDGGSTDGTLELINANNDIVSHYISEPDQGIYDAWNKGMSLAKGEYVLFLGAGDLFKSGTLTAALNMLTNTDENKIFLGEVRKFKDGQVTYVSRPRLNRGHLQYGLGYLHPGSIIEKAMYESVMPFDQAYSIAADVKALLMIDQLHKPQRVMSPLVVYMDDNGVSSRNWVAAAFQYVDILKELSQGEHIHPVWKKLVVLVRFILFKKLQIRMVMRFMKTMLRNAITSIVNTLMAILPFFSIRRIILLAVKAKIDKTSSIHRKTRILTPWRLKIGKNCTVNREAFLDARGGLELKDNVMIGNDVSVYSMGHDINDPFFASISRKVSINSNAVVFPHSVIQPGVNIGEGAVILPGSVVVKDVPDFHVVGGSPAKYISTRTKELYYKLEYRQWLAL